MNGQCFDVYNFFIDIFVKNTYKKCIYWLKYTSPMMSMFIIYIFFGGNYLFIYYIFYDFFLSRYHEWINKMFETDLYLYFWHDILLLI